MLGTRRRSARVRALARPNTAINGKRSRTDRLFSRSARSQIARLTPALPEQLLRRSRGAQKLLRAPKEADYSPKYGPKAALARTRTVPPLVPSRAVAAEGLEQDCKRKV